MPAMNALPVILAVCLMPPGLPEMPGTEIAPDDQGGVALNDTPSASLDGPPLTEAALILEESNERRADEGRELERSLAERRALQRRQTRLFAGLIVPGLVFWSASGITLLAAREPSTRARDVCTVGKPCGNACISVSDTCEIGSGGSGSPGSTRVTPVGWAVAGAFFAVGFGLILASIIAPLRLQPRRVACGSMGCSFTLRF